MWKIIMYKNNKYDFEFVLHKSHEIKYFQDKFSIPDSPIWMDSSTQSQCKQLEEKVGGPMVSFI